MALSKRSFFRILTVAVAFTTLRAEHRIATESGGAGALADEELIEQRLMAREASEPHQKKGMKETPFPPDLPSPEILRKRAEQSSAASTASDVDDYIFIGVTTVCTAAAVFGLVGAAVLYRMRFRATENAEYGPQYGVTGPAKSGQSSGRMVAASGDAKLASTAHLYHYQQTKQQILAGNTSGMDAVAPGEESEDSEGEQEEGDYSVYECPGLAPTGDIEVANPMFENDSGSPRARGTRGE